MQIMESQAAQNAKLTVEVASLRNQVEGRIRKLNEKGLLLTVDSFHENGMPVGQVIRMEDCDE